MVPAEWVSMFPQAEPTNALAALLRSFRIN
jgi:hypothetical protein